MPSLEIPDRCASRQIPIRIKSLITLGALALGMAATLDAEAAKLKYSSYIKGATVFRDTNANGDPDAGEPQTITDDDGNFEMAKAKGRLYLKDGTDIRTGKPNTTLLTTPPASRAVGTLSALWQALLDRKKNNKSVNNKAIRVLLNVPAKTGLPDYAASPLSGSAAKPKPKPKTQTLIKRDAQQETLVQFLKALASKPKPSLKLHAAQADKPLPKEDLAIGAIADALLAGGTSQSLDLSDLATVRSTFANAAADPDLAIEQPTEELLDLLAVGMASLNKSLEQLSGNSPPADQIAVEDRLKHETDALAEAVNSGDYQPFQQIAFPPPVIDGISVDSGADATDHVTNDTTPSLFGTVDRAATLVRVYSVDPASGARTKLADVTPEANGNWSYTSAELTDGSYRFGVTGVAQGATEVETGLTEITVQIDHLAPSDGTLSVTGQTTNLRTPTITGTWDATQNNTLSVTVNGIVYTTANGLDLSQGSNWRLAIPQPHQLPDGDYDVRAVVTDGAGNSAADASTNDLTVASAQGFNFTVGDVPRAVAFASLNADSQADLVVANQNANTVSVLLGSGNNSFQTAASHPVGSAPVAIAAGDIDGDGDADVVTANFAGGTISLLLNDGSGALSAPTTAHYPAGSKPTALALGHFNGDALLDAAVTDAGTDSLLILLNNGNGGFAAPVQYAAGALPYGIAIADLNADEATDIVVVNRNGNSASAFLGNGNGTFQVKRDHPVGSEPAALALGDINGDGKPDLAAGGGCCNVAVALGNGDGSFQPVVLHATGSYPYAVVIADVGGDNGVDVATANWGSNSVSVLVGDGSGAFPSSLAYGAGANPVALAPGDTNGDGRADLAVANYSSGTVSLLPTAAIPAVSAP